MSNDGMRSNVHFVVRSSTNLDAERLEQCFHIAAERQRLLSDPSGEGNGKRGVDFCLQHVELEQNKDEELVDRWMEQAQESLTGFSVVVRLLRPQGEGSSQDILIVAASRHIVDPLSLCLYVSDVKVLYESTGQMELPPLEVQYDEYKLWRMQNDEVSEAQSNQVAFWQEILTPPLPRLELPIDYKTTNLAPSSSCLVSLCNMEISIDLSDQIRQFSLDFHIPVRVLLLAGFHILLGRYSGKSDIIIGCHASHHGLHIETKNLIGHFENWLPIRVKSEDHPSLHDFIKRCAKQLLDGEANADVTQTLLKEKLGVDNLFDAGFEVYGNTVDDYSFPLITTRLLRLVLGLEGTGYDGQRFEDYVDFCKPSPEDPQQTKARVNSSSSSERSGSTSSDDDEDGDEGHDEEEYHRSRTMRRSMGPKRAEDQSKQQGNLSKPFSIGGISLEPIPVRFGVENSDDMIRLVGVTSPLIRLALKYDRNQYSEHSIKRMVTHYECILKSILQSYATNHQDMRLADLSVMLPIEEEIVLNRFNDTGMIVPEDVSHSCVHELVQRQAKLNPDAIAISIDQGKTTLTYAELEQKSNQLANFLLLIGCQKETLVPVLMHRGIDLIVSWLAVLKAGGAIMPMDPNYPKERVTVMVNDATATIVITESALQHLIPSDLSEHGHVIQIDKDWDRFIKMGSTSDVGRKTRPENLAYVIYTSGSTGKPKGVMLEHRSIVNYMYWHVNYYEMSKQDRVFACAGLAFDASMADTWPTLFVGACLLPIVNGDIMIVPPRFLDWIIQERASMGFLTTQICEMVLEEESSHPRSDQDLSNLRLFYTGGDRLHFGPRKDAPYKLVNIYGPTENTVNSSMTYVDNGVKVPPLIGAPAPNTQCYVLDPDTFRPVPIGVFGELFVGGVQLARGYFNLPEMTRDRFIANPLLKSNGPVAIASHHGEKLYRTGDLVRWLENGQLEFLGRKDTQVKIRGNRVELTAIESKLLEHERIKDAVVIAREDTPGQKRLVAFFVADVEQGEVNVELIKGHLKSSLPQFMIPSAFISLERLPLTANHKVDRALLAKVPPQSKSTKSQSFSQQEQQQQSNIHRTLDETQSHDDGAMKPLMRKARQIFLSVLGIEDDAHLAGETMDDFEFFDRGGDSLSAGRVTAQMSRLIGMEIPVSLLYKFPTVKKYCKAVLVAQNASDSIEPFGKSTMEQSLVDRLHEIRGPNHDEMMENAASWNEESLWLVCQRSDSFASQAYNVPFSCVVENPKEFLDEECLRKAIELLYQHCEVLRCTYHESSTDRFLVERKEESNPKIDFVVVEQLDVSSESEVKDWLEKETYEAFNFRMGPLLRVRLAYALGKQYLLVVVHHIIIDLWSLVLLLDRLFRYYEYYHKNDPSLPVPNNEECETCYRHFIQYQREMVKSAKGQQMLDFWKRTITKDDSLYEMELPLDFARPPKKSFKGGAKLFQVAPETSEKVFRLCQQMGITMNVFLLSTFTILLRKYTGCNHVSVGVPTTGRVMEELENVIGYFVNPIVVRADLSGNPSLTQLFSRVSHSVLNGLDNQALPFPYLVEQMNVGGGDNPLFSVAFVLQRPYLNRDGLANCMLGFDDVDLKLFDEQSIGIKSFTTPHRHAQFDLTLMVSFENGQISGSMQYSSDIFEIATIQRMVSHYVSLVENIVGGTTDPEQTRICDLNTINAMERQTLLHDFNNPKVHQHISLETDVTCVHHFLERTAAAQPEKIAIQIDDRTMTYGELDKRANQLSNFLRFTGVGIETMVPVLLERSFDCIVAWLAVLKAGGTLMPMDPGYPTERIAAMLEDSNACTVISQSKLIPNVPSSFEGHVIDIEKDWETAIKLASSKPLHKELGLNGSSCAYAIFTSGSTGKPKGVLLEHHSIVNYINWHLQYYEMTDQDRVFACAGLAFDASMADTWPTFACGSCLLPIVDQDISVVPYRLLEWVSNMKATMGFLTTQICEMVLEEESNHPRQDINHLRLLYTGGDRLHFGTRADAPYKLVNIYGPTENTVNSSLCVVPPGLTTPPLIGFPTPNTQCFVLDGETMEPVPIGVFGELFVSGVQLARGYFKLPDLTKEKFVPNPFHKTDNIGSEQLYRTGDIVRWKTDGQLEFLGRKDTQVKIRGNRIELTAIESTLLMHDTIKDAVVLARQDDPRKEKRLVAYVVPKDLEKELSSSMLKDFLKLRLPKFMIPSAFVQMTKFPLTSNHKIDRKALPSPNKANALGGKQNGGGGDDMVMMVVKQKASPHSKKAYYVSKTTTQVTQMFAKALDKSESELAPNSDFFEEGGHSLSAARIMSQVRATFGVDVPLSKFLQDPTVKGLSRYVERGMKRNLSRKATRGMEGLTTDDMEDDQTNTDSPVSGGELEHKSDARSLRTPNGVSFASSVNSNKVRFSMNSLVSSSYRNSAISSWLNAKKRRQSSATAESVDDAESNKSDGGSYSSSSNLRRARERTNQEMSQMMPQQQQQQSHQAASMKTVDMLSSSPFTFAHSPMWLDTPSRLRTLHKRHGAKTSPSIHRAQLSVLSYNQQSLWFLHKMNPKRVDFVVHACLELELRKSEETLDVSRFHQALQELVNRHDSLRTGYGEDNGVPYQVIHPPSSDGISVFGTVDFEFVVIREGESLEASLNEQVHRPWLLESQSPFRARLYRTVDHRYVFLLTAHHIAMDGWSLDILLEDLGRLYDDVGHTNTLPSKGMSVWEFARLQKEEINASSGNRLWNFWQRQLAGHQAFLDLPTDFSRANVDNSITENGAWHHFHIPDEHMKALQMAMKLERATLFMSLLAFYAAFLFRYTGKEEILIGTPMACRTIPELDRTVGNITNIVVLRMHVSKEDTFRSLLRQARAVVLSAFEHQEFPFSVLVERLSSYRQANQNPLFQVLLSLNQSFGMNTGGGVGGSDGTEISLAKLEAGETVRFSSTMNARKYHVEQNSSPYELQWIVNQGSAGSGLHASFQYKTTLFTKETVENMSQHLLSLIEGSANYNRPYCSIPILSKAEQDKMLVTWNGGPHDFPTNCCIHQLFEEQVGRNPYLTAVSHMNHSWSYMELNRLSNVLARYLRLRCKVEPGRRVGISVDRSPNMILTMLAVSKAGGAYVPMDVSWPVERLLYVFKDSQMAVILCDQVAGESGHLLKQKAKDGEIMMIQLDGMWDKIVKRVKKSDEKTMYQNLPPPTSSSWGSEEEQWHGSRSVAYMIYTSGSTGNPKGVLIEHRSLVNLVVWHVNEYRLTENDRSSQLVGSAFDPVGLEVWPFISVGASIHFVDNQTRSDVTALTKWLHNNRITVTLLPTPLLEVFLKVGQNRWPKALRVVYGGGDKLHVPSSILKSLPFRLDNHYGPSEGTIMCTFYQVNELVKMMEENESTVPAVFTPCIGRPLNNFVVLVLDEYLEPVPALVHGELCIIGPGLARGYHNRASLTRKKFLKIPDHILNVLHQLHMPYMGNVMYRTGDRVRFLRDGTIEFIGRVDFQVKIRGMRVELGEIESILKQHAGVMEACVLAREDTPGQQRLCAYIVLEMMVKREEEVEQIHELSSLVKDKLPIYMVPSTWMFLEALPVTPNGKIDRKALPKPPERATQLAGKALNAVVTPRSAEEVILVDLWKSTLGLETISVHDNFFDLGGHSLAATQLLSLVHDTLNVEVPITTFFSDPSVAGMAKSIVKLKQQQQQQRASANGEEVVETKDGKRINNDFDKSTPTSQDLQATLVENLGFDPEREIQLDDIEIPAHGGNLSQVANDWSSAFLTGGTGFLGAFLIDALFSEPKGNELDLFCLVRAKDEGQAKVRLITTLKKYDLLSFKESDEAKFEIFTLSSFLEDPAFYSPQTKRGSTGRLIIVCGDLALPYFGLNKATFSRLAEYLHIIFHCGAYVHSLFPYSRLRAPNVGGTQEVIRFAFSRYDRPIVVINISTLSVFASSKTDHFKEEGSLTEIGDLHMLEGYAQTKWVGEHLIQQAIERGLPALTLRPGRITGHSVTGMASFSDFLCLFLKGCIQLQCAPDLGWMMDMNPVDYVCKAIIALSRKQEKYIGHSFNMCHPEPLTLRGYFDCVTEFGYVCPVVPYTEWREKLLEVVRSSPKTRAKKFAEKILEPTMLSSTFSPHQNSSQSISGSIRIQHASGSVNSKRTSSSTSGFKKPNIISKKPAHKDGEGEEDELVVDVEENTFMERNALYPLLPMFLPDSSQMQAKSPPLFECTKLIDMPVPDHTALNHIYFERMIQQEFIPPPPKDKYDDFFTFE